MKKKTDSRKRLDEICTEIDRIFDLYGKPGDNCIVLGAYYDSPDHDCNKWMKGHSYVCEDPLALSAAGKFRYFSQYYDWDYKYNPHVRPVMHDVSAFTHLLYDDGEPCETAGEFLVREGILVAPVSRNSIMYKHVDMIPMPHRVEQLRDYYRDAEKLVSMIKPVMHAACGSASSLCDDSTNEYWRNYVAVLRDYRFISFTMRYDAMMADEQSTIEHMAVDSPLASCGHLKRSFQKTKDYGPDCNPRVREPVPFIEWKEWESHIARQDDSTYYHRPPVRADSPESVPFNRMKLKELPISLITDIFLQHYSKGSDPVLSNMFFYEPNNRDEDIYGLCQNSVYKYDYFGTHQVAFNWNTLCCLHGDVINATGTKSTRVAETYIGDMTPGEFIEFIRTALWRDSMEYTGDEDLLHYGLRIRKFHPDRRMLGRTAGYPEFSLYRNQRKPWYLTIDQFERAKNILKLDF